MTKYNLKFKIGIFLVCFSVVLFLALPILPNGLRQIGNNVTTAIVYQNTMPENIVPLNLRNVDSIAFASPSGVDNFLKIYGSIPEGKHFFSKGKVTLTRMIERGFPKDSIELK